MKKIINTLLVAITVMSCGNNPKKAEAPEANAWQENSGTGIHYMYIGEILHVWKK